jgi:hypothetical protein
VRAPSRCRPQPKWRFPIVGSSEIVIEALDRGLERCSTIYGLISA